MRLLSFKISNIILFLLMCAAFTQVACKKDSGISNPVIEQVRLLDSTKRDSFFTSVLPGTTIVIQGHGFSGLLHVYFNDADAGFNSALNSDNNIIITVPADAPTEATNPDVSNNIRVVTNHGEATFDFILTAPPPTVSGASNEMALPGDQFTIYGSNFYIIDKVVFPGDVEVTNFSVNDDATAITLTVPTGVTSGPIQVVNKFGTGTSVFLFDDNSTGVLCNFDNVSNFSWGCPVSSDAAAYPGGWGSFAQMQFSGVPANDGAWWNWGRSLNTNSGTWVPSDHLTDPLSSYAVKFEIYVKQPWSTGSFYVVKDYSFTYVGLYEPWKQKADFTTNGWQTVTVPLDQFKTDNGTGTPPSTLTDLVGSGSGNIDIMFVNNTGTEVASFDAAVDNVRVVKIN